MEKIKCVCGKELDKDYTKMVLIAGENGNNWSFFCDNCGQPFLEKVKEPIILKNG